MFGDIFTVEDWLDMVDSGALIDYDGHGNPLGVAPSKGERSVLIPSAFFMAPRPPETKQRVGVVRRSLNRAWLRANYAYVVWYNR